MCKRKGFTLIELLVVIAIIALLMAILMPALSRVRNQAKTTTGQTKLKQWGAILSMYADDNDAHFCSEDDSWMNELRRYYKDSNDLRLCPMAVKPKEDGTNHGYKPIAEKFTMAWGKYPRQSGDEWITVGDYGSYGINNWICHKLGTSAGTATRYWRTPAVKNAGQVPAFLDCISHASHGEEGPRATQVPPKYECERSGKNAIKYYCIDRHNGSINAVFLDSSVRKVGLKELWTLKWNPLFDINGEWTTAGGVKPGDWPKWMQRYPDF